ncbi:MAG: MFS transporter [Rhodospirillaceae bacterium]|nr:MFS transporter [Rhodospirillaceae bacterium]
MPVILLAVTINAIPVSLVLPMLPFLGARYGASPWEVSVLFALMPVVGILGNPLWGRVADARGRRFALICTLGGTALAFVGFALADSLWALFATRALQGLFHGANSIALAYVALNTAPDQRAKGMGRVMGAMGVGLAIGPSIGGLLTVGAGDDFDHTVPCLVAGALSALAALVVAVALKEAAIAKVAGAKPKPKARFADAARVPAVWLLLAMIFASGFKFNAEQFIFPYWGMARGWSASTTSFATAVLSLGFLVTSFAGIGWLTKKFGEEKAMLITAGLDLVVVSVFMAFAASPYAFACMMVLSLSSPVWGTVLASVLSRHAPEGHQGTILGLSTSTQLAGRIAGALVAGLLADAYGYLAVYAAVAVLLMFIVAQSWRFVAGAQRLSPKP